MIYFTAHTFNCVCHCIRAMFRVLGMYNFVSGYRLNGRIIFLIEDLAGLYKQNTFIIFLCYIETMTEHDILGMLFEIFWLKKIFTSCEY